MIKLRKKYKELNLLVSIKLFMTCIFSIPKKVTTIGRKTPKNIIFYTHYFTFSYIYYRQPKTVGIINWKYFEIMVNL